ncbi:MAG: translation initiation factor IF-6 [archaeon]
MRIVKNSVNGSAFVGIFGCVTENLGLMPMTLKREEVKKIEKDLEIDVIQTNIGNSSLIGVLCAGNKKGFIVSDIIEAKELKLLEQQGIRMLVVSGHNAIANLLAVNDFGGVASKTLNKATVKKIESFLKLELTHSNIDGIEIVGSSIVATNKGFLIHPKVSETKFKEISKALKVKGNVGTANYGDPFVRNSILANSNSAIVGEMTSGQELLRIDESLGGEGQ